MIIMWGITWVVMGLAGWPLTSVIFSKWEDKGYLFSKITGAVLTGLLVWFLGSFRILPFGVLSWAISAAIVALLGFWLGKKNGLTHGINWKLVLFEEGLFFTAFIFWTFIKSHEPSISGLEKFMDFGFTKSILRSQFFPPQDMWFSGEKINYYYFGHLLMAVISKISGVSLEYGFNLTLATLFAMCLTMSMAIGRELLSKYRGFAKYAGAFFIAFLVTSAGNLHTIYAFTSGYWGEDNPPPFWQIILPNLKVKTITEGFNNYWYPNATRFIPYTIHEFPSYSFVVSDIHGHVLSIPIVLLLIALLADLFISRNQENRLLKTVFYGVVSGAAFMTNALDGPIYIGLFGMLLIINHRDDLRKIFSTIVIIGSTFLMTSLPFLISFKPFVNGIAVNCPPAWLSNQKIGPVLFEGIEKCQRSPFWMMLILWGFFWFCTTGLGLFGRKDTPHRNVLLTWSFFSTLLIIFAEFFYFKDIYPQHFRSNTMFKLGYQAFILMSLVSGYSIVTTLLQKNKTLIMRIFMVLVTPLLMLVSIYPYFAVRSYFGELKDFKGIWGLSFLEERIPDDLAAINWLNKNVKGQPVVLEAAGDSYTDYERISTFTGLPTVAGWAVHEWLWRGSYEPIANRATDVATIYESDDINVTKFLTTKYKIKYIVVGEMERTKYPNILEQKIEALGQEVFSSGTTQVYELTI